MKTIFSILALSLGLTAAAGVTPDYQLRSRDLQSNAKSGFETRVAEREGAFKKAARVSKVADSAPRKVVGAAGDAINFTDEIGILHLMVEEDFSLLTQGSEDEPFELVKLDYTRDQCMEKFDNVWYSFKPEYTHTPNWGVNSSYPAGGCLYMLADGGQAHLNTPLIKLDTYAGLGVLEFKARTRVPGAKYNELYIEAAETNGMAATWRFLESCVVENITNEWTTYRILMPNCGPTTMFNIVMMRDGELFLDDVKVYEIEPYVGVPNAKAHTDYEGTSFTAHWDAVDGADKYLLSVYQYGADNEKYFHLENEEVTGVSHNVTGVESGEIYYYSVRAMKGDKVSLEGNEHRVFDLERPRFKTSEAIGDFGYKASWEYVPGADVFNYMAYNKRVAKEDGEFVITDEKFDYLTDADGYPTGLTKDDPADECYVDFYPMQMHQQGWHGTNCYAYDDYISLDAYFYEMGDSDSGFVSPEMDFSKDGGKFTLKADLAGNTSEVYDENYKLYRYTTQACVALFNYNEEKGDFEQVELVYPDKDVTEDFQTITFNLTKGSERSKVGIYAIRSFCNLYVDNILITQNYKKDEYLIAPFKFEHWYGRAGNDPYTIDVEVPAYATGTEVYHKVSAYGRVVVGQDYNGNNVYEDRESRYSDREYVRTTVDNSAVEGVKLQESMVTLVNGVLNIQNPMLNRVVVCTLDGTVLYTGSENEINYTLPCKGVYLVNNKKVVY